MFLSLNVDFLDELELLSYLSNMLENIYYLNNAFLILEASPKRTTWLNNNIRHRFYNAPLYFSTSTCLCVTASTEQKHKTLLFNVIQTRFF